MLVGKGWYGFVSEKIKMLNGNLYDASAEELVAERLYAQEILFDFNSGLRPNLKTLILAGF